MSLGAGYGVQGGYDALQNILAQRIAEEQRAKADQQQQFENSLKTRQLDQNDELKKMQIAAQLETAKGAAADRASAESDRRIGLANTLADQIPAGATMAPTDPAVGMLRTGGRGALLQHQDPTLASTAIAGQSTLPGAAMPQATGMIRTQNAGNPEQFLKLPSANQQNTLADNARADAAAKQLQDFQTRQLAIQQQNANTNANKPAATITVQTVDENGKPITKIVPKTAGASYEKPPSAVTANRLDSAQAVQQTGNDIIAKVSDPKYAATLGPALGRAGSVRDFIGNPPPEFSELAGQIESYALANMGVHGMRSAQGAAQISKLLDQHHTPESLAAAIKGLNGFSQHFMENAGRTTSAPASSPKVIKYDINGKPIQ